MTDQDTTRTDATTSDATTDATTTAGGVNDGESGNPTTMPATPPIGSDAVGATSGSPVTKIADSAAEAAKQAGAKLKEAAQSADLDELADQAKRVTGQWTERIKEEYRRRPGVVIGAAVGAVVLLGAIARGLGRRR